MVLRAAVSTHKNICSKPLPPTSINMMIEKREPTTDADFSKTSLQEGSNAAAANVCLRTRS
jgi:hypothetical protein